MKHRTIIYAAVVTSMLVSCKSHKDVLRRESTTTGGESLVTVVDTSKTHLETSLETDYKKQEETNTFVRETEFDTLGNVTKTVETLHFVNLQVDFASKLDQLKRDDFNIIGSAITTDSTHTTIDEQIKQGTDSRPIQGWEWALVSFGAIGFVAALIAFYSNYKSRRL